MCVPLNCFENGGVMSEYVVLSEKFVGKKPENISVGKKIQNSEINFQEISGFEPQYINSLVDLEFPDRIVQYFK